MAIKSLRNIWVMVLMSLVEVLMAQNHYSFQRDINYRGGSEADGYMSEMCRLDVAYVGQSTGKPVIIWFHGGGLTGGRREIPHELLQDSIIVVGVEYRLSPKATVDEIIDDAAASTAWVIGNIGRYGGDSRKVFVSGHSAGGYLADMLALDKSRLGKYGIDADSLAGVIPFSGQCITHFEARNRQGIHPLQPTVDTLAPLYHVREHCPPFLIISGDREKELYGRYEEQAYLWRMLKLRGNEDVTLYELDGFDHGGMCRPAFPLLLQFVRDHSTRPEKQADIAPLQCPEKSVPRSKIIAHRGWWKHVDKETQNSRAAVRAAFEAGFYGCEIDTWITSDDVLYVNHDASFGGVTLETSPSTAVASLTLSNGEKMPTLEELLKIMQEYPQSPTKLIIELKEHASAARMKACAQAAVDLVASYGLEPRVEYISFSLDACKQLREISPETPVAYLRGGIAPAALAPHGINLDYHQDEFKNNPGWIDEARALGLTTNVWTVDDEATMLDFNLAGVDFITTNLPSAPRNP